MNQVVLRHRIDVLADGIVLADADGRIALANRQVAAIFGYRPGELAGQVAESPDASRGPGWTRVTVRLAAGRGSHAVGDGRPAASSASMNVHRCIRWPLIRSRLRSWRPSRAGSAAGPRAEGPGTFGLSLTFCVRLIMPHAR